MVQKWFSGFLKKVFPGFLRITFFYIVKYIRLKIGPTYRPSVRQSKFAILYINCPQVPGCFLYKAIKNLFFLNIITNCPEFIMFSSRTFGIQLKNLLDPIPRSLNLLPPHPPPLVTTVRNLNIFFFLKKKEKKMKNVLKHKICNCKDFKSFLFLSQNHTF